MSLKARRRNEQKISDVSPDVLRGMYTSIASDREEMSPNLYGLIRNYFYMQAAPACAQQLNMEIESKAVAECAGAKWQEFAKTDSGFTAIQQAMQADNALNQQRSLAEQQRRQQAGQALMMYGLQMQAMANPPPAPLQPPVNCFSRYNGIGVGTTCQ